MLKKFIKDYYKFRLHKLTEAIQDLERHDHLYYEYKSLCYQQLRLNLALKMFYLEFFKGLPYVDKIIKTQ